MMKKTITLLLLTALCMTVFVSCDLGNGLVAELLGDIKDVTIGEQNYPTNDYIAIETDIIIDIPPSVEDIMTTPPYEIMTEEYTGPYTTGEDWTYDCIEPVPDVQIDFSFKTMECQYGDHLEMMPVEGDLFSSELYLPYDTVSFSFGGEAVLYSGWCTLGYRIDDEYVFDDSFWGVGTDSEPEYRELRIEIPADLLLDGYNEVTLLYAFDGLYYEIGTIIVFKELPTTAGEDTVDAVVEETVEEATTEIEIAVETEIDTEIEFPEIDIDD